MDMHILTTLMLIGALSAICQLCAWWTRIPSILFLLLTGIVLGPITGYLNPDILFGDLLFPLISLAVAVILFEGSLSLKFSQIRGQSHTVLVFIFLGGLITWLGVTLATRLLLSIDWSLCALVGAILVVTGPTVIMPMLRAINPDEKISKLLRWEGIILDPFGALFAILVFDFIITGQQYGLGHTIWYFTKMLIAGSTLGLISGYILSEILRRHLLPEFLINIVVLNCVFVAFVLANLIYHETGLLTVTVMGLVLANRKNVELESIIAFKETMSTLLISGLFIVLGARVYLPTIIPMIIPSLLLFSIMQLIIRPIKVAITTYKSSLTWRHKTLVAWIAPRGIIAAAIASLFEMRLTQFGYGDVTFITPLIFMIIVYSVMLPSFTGTLLSRALHVSDPEQTGVLIIGANYVAREIAKVLKKHIIHVIVADTSWENISTARLEGIPTYYGNPISEHADYNMNLIGIGKLMSITPNSELGVVAGIRFSKEFGKNNIYYLQTGQEQRLSDKYQIAKHHRGSMLFSDTATYQSILRLLNAGAQIKATTLTEQYDYDAYINSNIDIIPLFAFDPKDKLKIFTVNHHIKPDKDWTIVSLVPSNK